MTTEAAARETAEMERHRKRMDALLGLCDTREDCVRVFKFFCDELERIESIIDETIARIEAKAS